MIFQPWNWYLENYKPGILNNYIRIRILHLKLELIPASEVRYVKCILERDNLGDIPWPFLLSLVNIRVTDSEEKIEA
jgi:hypothetical protein